MENQNAEICESQNGSEHGEYGCDLVGNESEFQSSEGDLARNESEFQSSEGDLASNNTSVGQCECCFQTCYCTLTIYYRDSKYLPILNKFN